MEDFFTYLQIGMTGLFIAAISLMFFISIKEWVWVIRFKKLDRYDMLIKFIEETIEVVKTGQGICLSIGVVGHRRGYSKNYREAFKYIKKRMPKPMNGLPIDKGYCWPFSGLSAKMIAEPRVEFLQELIDELEEKKSNILNS